MAESGAKDEAGPHADASPQASEAPGALSGVAPEAVAQDQTDPALEAVLAELWSAWSQQSGPLSLARLCKRTGLRMSTLKRFLTELERCEIASICVNARGVEAAALTDAAAASMAEAAAGSEPEPG
jgi:hypothetical protein